MSPTSYKIPVSVLVVVHTPALEVLMLERVKPAGLWQSVTGSLEAGEKPLDAAVRELGEETGIVAAPAALADWHQTNRFVIRPEWRARYAPEVTHNVEHVFSLALPFPVPVRLAADEHSDSVWLPWEDAAVRAFSWTNREAILSLPHRLAAAR